jgi:hypothetical protein
VKNIPVHIEKYFIAMLNLVALYYMREFKHSWTSSTFFDRHSLQFPYPDPDLSYGRPSYAIEEQAKHEEGQ